MLTTRDAAKALSQLATSADLGACSAALGFAAPLPLDRGTARRLGFGATELRLRVAAGRGSLRALLLTRHEGAPVRSSLPTLARGLARAAPGQLWLLIAHDATSGEIVIAAPPADGSGPVAALVLDPTQVRESDAETFAAMAGAADGPDLLVHARWCETLGRDALTRRFYRELEAQVSALAESAEGRAPSAARRTIALLHASRLLFVAFLEARGWLDDDREFLRRHFAARAGGSGAHRRFLEPLWFGTLNTPASQRAPSARRFGRVPFLNGGLFTRAPIERQWRDLRLQDDAIGGFLDRLLGRYRLTARESSSDWSDAAVDPEMLGRAFESLMQPETRRAMGAFYTPPALVAELAREGITNALTSLGVSELALRGHFDGRPIARGLRDSVLRALDGFRILDPACGSGAFLVHAMDELSSLRAAAGDARESAARLRDVLTRSIFGVDRDPIAVWLCQLRLWLAVMVEEPDAAPGRLAPLPNLDHNIREGDALAGHGFDDARLEADTKFAERRMRYTRASGSRKQTLGKLLEREERARVVALHEARLATLTAQRRDLLASARSPDLFAGTGRADQRTRAALQALRRAVRLERVTIAGLRAGAALPFSFATHFPEAATAGGFSLVLGNPPWVRTHAIPPDERATLRERFEVFRGAAWEAGALAAAAGRGFASQVDVAALFTERAVRLALNGGSIALLLPAKLWGSLAGGGVRAFLTRHAPPLLLEDWSGSSAGFDAVVYPSAIVARRVAGISAAASARPGTLRVTVHRANLPLTWTLPRGSLALDDSPGAPWLLLPLEVREAFDCLTRAGTALAESPLGRPLLGVKSGCNAAFILTPEAAARERIESELLRPLLRGEDCRAWRTEGDAPQAIIWTHDRRGVPCGSLPAGALRRLSRWRRTLELRSDRGGARWWSLFRTEAARADSPRVVWGDIGRAPRALVLRAGDPTVPLNTCYVLRTQSEDDAHALAVLLNSPVGAAWLAALAEPARGGYRRFLGWTCARFPVPARWSSVRDRLASLGRAAASGESLDAWTLTEAALEAYGVRHADVAALLSWHGL